MMTLSLYPTFLPKTFSLITLSGTMVRSSIIRVSVSIVKVILSLPISSTL